MSEKPGPSGSNAECPICTKQFPADSIEMHVNRCIFLNSTEFDKPKESNKRSFSIFNGSKNNESPDNANKKLRNTNSSTSSAVNKTLSSPTTKSSAPQNQVQASDTLKTKMENVTEKSMPLAEKMRPKSIEDYIGQMHVMDKNAILRKILDKNETPSMILWGPPGVGKTTLAHIIAARCKETQSTRFVKLSATMAGVSDIKQAVAAAKNEQKFGRKTILFMDEIHRFNKLQQVFLTSFHSFNYYCVSIIFYFFLDFFISGHILAACREWSYYIDWSDHGKSIVQFKFSTFEPLSSNCSE